MRMIFIMRFKGSKRVPRVLRRHLVFILLGKVILLAIIYGCCFRPALKVRVNAKMIQSTVFGLGE
jgi:hypothetical protein